MKRQTCRVAGCRRSPHAQGLCQQHYDQQRKKPRRGAPRGGRPSAGRAPAPAAAQPADLRPDAALAGKLCCVPGCTAPHHARGYCKSHYGQLRRHGGVAVDSGEADGRQGPLTKERRLLEIIKRHDVLKKEISSIHKELESEAHEE